MHLWYKTVASHHSSFKYIFKVLTYKGFFKQMMPLQFVSQQCSRVASLLSRWPLSSSVFMESKDKQLVYETQCWKVISPFQ